RSGRQPACGPDRGVRARPRLGVVGHGGALRETVETRQVVQPTVNAAELPGVNQSAAAPYPRRRGFRGRGNRRASRPELVELRRRVSDQLLEICHRPIFVYIFRTEGNVKGVRSMYTYFGQPKH